MSPKRVVWSESFGEEEELVEALSTGNLQFTFHRTPFQEIAVERLPEEFVLTTRTHSDFSRPEVERACCVISRSTGYDHLPVGEIDVPLGYLPTYATEAVAEFNLTLALNLIRRLPRVTAAMENFERSGLTGRELTSFTAGIVGVGRIGRATARRLRGLDVPVKGHDIEPRPEWAADHGVDYVGLPEIFQSCDLVFLTLPLTSETRGMIDRDLLFSLPEAAVLVNTGRGEVVRSRDLLAALESGPLAGLGIDVYNREDSFAAYLKGTASVASDAAGQELAAAEKLLAHPAVVATPHNAFNTESALHRKVAQTLDSIEQFCARSTLPHPVPED